MFTVCSSHWNESQKLQEVYSDYFSEMSAARISDVSADQIQVCNKKMRKYLLSKHDLIER